MGKRLKLLIISVLILLVLVFVLLLTGCAMDNMTILADKGPTQEELLAKIPKMNGDAYNRFRFDLTIFAGNRDGDGKDYTMSTAMETWKDMAHMYNTHVYFAKSGYEADTENWADFGKDICYQNAGEGWSLDKTKNTLAMEYLLTALNDRQTGFVLTSTDEVLTLSWAFPTDVEYLFGPILGHYTTDTNLNGYGRTTAVFDPQTQEFQYFTVVVSANNEELSGALLDMVLYWDVKNDKSLALDVPEDVSNAAYLQATGIINDGGYDETVNPLAESFIRDYGGTAEVNHDDNGAYMFWTVKQDDGLSASVSYTKETDPVSRFEENFSFLVSLYGQPAEETEDGAYFYNKEAGELTYMARGTDWYAEVTITGKPSNTQGELRKPLITYKSRLKI